MVWADRTPHFISVMSRKATNISNIEGYLWACVHDSLRFLFTFSCREDSNSLQGLRFYVFSDAFLTTFVKRAYFWPDSHPQGVSWLLLSLWLTGCFGFFPTPFCVNSRDWHVLISQTFSRFWDTQTSNECHMWDCIFSLSRFDVSMNMNIILICVIGHDLNTQRYLSTYNAAQNFGIT